MKSLRQQEGYLLVDHRVSPGVPSGVMEAQGWPAGAGQGLFETATYTCAHCQYVVVMEPKRTRPRAVCLACYQRICDGCEVVRQQTLTCRSMARLIDDTLETSERAEE
jgi:hypothetical protein